MEKPDRKKFPNYLLCFMHSLIYSHLAALPEPQHISVKIDMRIDDSESTCEKLAMAATAVPDDR
jgi:hypothetical protein